MAWFITLLIGLVLNIVSYLLLPKAKEEQPAAVKDLEDPVAEAGRPMPVVFGTMLVKGLNFLYYGDKQTTKRYLSSGGKK